MPVDDGYFDRVPLEQMSEAQHAMLKAAASIPTEVSRRLDSTDKLSDEDRKIVVDTARQALEPFFILAPAKAKAERVPEPHVETATPTKRISPVKPDEPKATIRPDSKEPS